MCIIYIYIYDICTNTYVDRNISCTNTHVDRTHCYGGAATLLAILIPNDNDNNNANNDTTSNRK